MDPRVMNGGGVLFSNPSSSSSSSSSSKHSHEEEHEDDMNTMMEDLRRGPWKDEEDQKLSSYIARHGEGRWNSLARVAGLNRTGKSCRLRWLNYLRPDVRRGNISLEEQLLILELHSRLGNRWSKIAKYLPGRTDNEIKNYWRTRVQKHAKQLKCDVNSQQFKDTMRYLWMPRLVEKIQAAATDTNNHSTQAAAADQTQHTSCMGGGYESYGPFSGQVSPIPDLIDDDKDFANYHVDYQNNTLGMGMGMGYDCNYVYGQGELMDWDQNTNNKSDEWMRMMQNGDTLWNVDDFLFNNSHHQ